jgi:hypothetical protein
MLSVDRTLPTPGSIEEADMMGMPMLPEMTPEQTRAALEQSVLILGYVHLNLSNCSKPGSVGFTLARLILTYLDRMVPLAQLAAFESLELPRC